MTGRGRPRPPRWAEWAVGRLLPPEEVRLIRLELEELHALWVGRWGEREACRRFHRQWRAYPWLLLRARLRGEATAPRARRLGGGAGIGFLSVQDLSLSARVLARSPGLTAAIVLSVGLGIGACTAIFSLVDALYLRPLPYPDADRVVAIHTDAPPNRFPFSVVDFRHLEEHQTSFEAVGAYGTNRRTFLTDQGAELLGTLEATPGLLALWGIRPLQGRLPSVADGEPGAPPTALVTVGFARRHLGGGPDGTGVVGSTLSLDGEAFEVVGVLPASLGPLARNVDVLPTLRLDPPTRKGPFFLRAFGRLRPGVEPETALAELRSLNARLFPLWADSYQDRGASWGLQPIAEFVRGHVGPLITALMAAVGIVFVIALANAANLLVARVNARTRELAVRAALGASRARIWRHLLSESLLLAGGGVLLGLAVAHVGVAALPAMATAYIRGADDATLSLNVAAFAVALSAVSALLFSTLPLARGRSALAAELRSGDRGSTADRTRQAVPRILVAGQVALVLPLMVGAFLLLQSFARLQAVDPGFDAARLVSMRVALSPALHPTDVDRRTFWDAALRRIEAIPGVERAALASERPPTGLNDLNNFDLEDRPDAPGDPIRLAAWVYAGPGYFEAMGVPLLAGRSFVEADLDADAAPVLIVDEAWARANYPGEGVVGRRLYSGGQSTGPRATVVGVVGSVPYQGVGASQLGAFYAPTGNTFGEPYLLVRVAGDPAGVASAVQAELRRLDRTAPITEVASGEALLDDALTQPRHLSLLAGLFSAVALALSLLGIYGVTSYAVQQRRADIAVRLALGGDAASVLRTTLWNGMRLVVAGLVVGVAAAVASTRVLSGLLYGVAPSDPGALAAAGGLLLTVSAVATLVPALRAVRLDPAKVLREE